MFLHTGLVSCFYPMLFICFTLSESELMERVPKRWELFQNNVNFYVCAIFPYTCFMITEIKERHNQN